MEELWDLLAFAAVLLTPSLATAAYFAFYRPVGSCQEFMFGKYALHWTSVGTSLAAYCLSPLTLLWPAESARTGTTWLIGVLFGFLAASLVVSVVHAPILHYNRSISIFQYLEDRFRSKFLRYLTFLFNIFANFAFCAGVATLCAQLGHSVFASLGAHARPWMLSAILCATSALCATIGGQKAAAFLGSFTLIFELFVALICAVCMGIYKLRSSNTFIPINSSFPNLNRDQPEENGEFSFLIPDYTFTSAATEDGKHYFDFRQNVWLTSAVCLLYFFYVLGCHQTSHQHYCSLSTKKRARYAIATAAAVFLIVWTLICALASLILHFHFDADRLRTCKYNLSTEYFIILREYFDEVWSNTNGARGYFIGCFTAATAFCCLPANLVSLASCTYEDVVKPYFCMNAEEKLRTTTLKLLTLIYSVLIFFASVAILETTVNFRTNDVFFSDFYWLYAKNIFMFLACVSAPFAALYVLAIWLPCTNAKGALTALAAGLTFASVFSAAHFARYPYDAYVQKSNGLLYRCCDEKVTVSDPNFRARRSPSVSTNLFENASTIFDDDWPRNNSEISNITLISNDTSTPFGEAMKSLGSACSTYRHLLITQNDKASNDNIFFRIPWPLQAILTFSLTILIGFLVSLLTGRQDIYALDWNLVYWTCNSLAGVTLINCFRRGNGFDASTYSTNASKDRPSFERPEQKRKRRQQQRGPYTTSESFRYSRQGPYPDTSYHNPKVQDYMATLTRNQTQTPA